VGLTFCPVCGGTHAEPRDCPGELRATGPERHGWRVAVETPFGIEAYAVLVAPSFDLWRSRIITYPNVLWTVPGGAVTVKFAGRSPQDAEAQAVAFVEAHINARGYVRRDGLDLPAVSRIHAEAAANVQATQGPALRKMRAMPVHFGTGQALFAAMTGNLSESGLFVMTLVPFDPGTDLRVLIDLETGRMGLRGKVVWKRERLVLGRPVGMGVQLVAPPEPYREFVLELP
jgi:Tfp pilus assembly protein PilZ